MSTLPGPAALAISSSTSPASRSVDSNFVPAGARKRSWNCCAPEAGKISRPSRGPTTTTMATVTTAYSPDQQAPHGPSRSSVFARPSRADDPPGPGARSCVRTVGLQQPDGEHGHERARQQERRDHRAAHRQRQRHEQRPRHAGHEKRRHEDGDHGQHRQQPRHHDFAAGVQDRSRDRCAASGRACGCFRSRPSPRPRGCRPPAPDRRAS